MSEFWGLPPSVRLRLRAMTLPRADTLRLYEIFVMEGEAAALRLLDTAVREPARPLGFVERWTYWLMI